MITEVRNKDELRSMINSLARDSNELDDVISDLRMQISRVRNYDGIDMKTYGRILKNNLDQIKHSINTDVKNINNYSNGIEILDKDDFNIFGDKFSNFIFNDLGIISKGFRNLKGNIINCKNYLKGNISLIKK